jgi:hypothetical protein
MLRASREFPEPPSGMIPALSATQTARAREAQLDVGLGIAGAR